MNERELFEAALEQTPEQRVLFLDKACAGDPTVRSRIEGLLAHHAEAESFLEKPAMEANVTGAYQPISEGAGTVIGPYKLLQKIGEGGFGVVFMAEQERPMRRMVALKIIKPGMDTAQVIARFESERQALALMDHPHIAKVLDAGATERVDKETRRQGDKGSQMCQAIRDIPSPCLRVSRSPCLQLVVPISSWSWSKACRSPNSATRITCQRKVG